MVLATLFLVWLSSFVCFLVLGFIFRDGIGKVNSWIYISRYEVIVLI